MKLKSKDKDFREKYIELKEEFINGPPNKISRKNVY